MTSQGEPMNATDNVTAYDAQFEHVVSIVVPTIFGIISVVGIVGNLLVIVVVVSNKQMRNTTNILIINLAIADLLFIVVCVPFTAIAYSLRVWPFGSVACKCYQYLLNVTAYVSVYTLVLMSFDRYLAVVHPFRSMTCRTERNAIVATALLWLVMLAFNVPILHDYVLVSYHFNGETRVACLNRSHIDSTWQARVFYGTFFAFCFVLPLAVICALYGLMLHRLLCGGLPRSNQSADNMRSKKRVARMVIIIVLVFALCWLPVHLMFVIQYFGPPREPSRAFVSVRIAVTCLAYMNSCVNPFLYAFLSENFRKSFYQLLCRGPRFNPTKSSHVSRAPDTRLLEQPTPMTALTESKQDLDGSM